MRTDYYKDDATVNRDADTLADAMAYLLYRTRQSLKFGYRPDLSVNGKIMQVSEDGMVVSVHLVNDGAEDELARKAVAYYVLRSARGKGRYLSAVHAGGIPVLTLDTCEHAEYLEERNLPCVIADHPKIYECMSDGFWAGKAAERSGVPYMYHLDEGMAVLKHLGADWNTLTAYCLHPVVQDDDDLRGVIYEATFFDSYAVSTHSLAIAMRFREVANSFLGHDTVFPYKLPKLDYYTRLLLIADKVQNYKDFKEYHLGSTHMPVDRQDHLAAYFAHWEKLLQVDFSALAVDSGIMFDYCIPKDVSSGAAFVEALSGYSVKEN